MEGYQKKYIKRSTFSRYRQLIDCRFLSHPIGKQEVTLITKMDVQNYISDLINTEKKNKTGKLSPSYINSVYKVINCCFKYAILKGIIVTNPCIGVVKPKMEKDKYFIKCFTRSEQMKIERYILNNLNENNFGVMVCLYTGIRVGELCALQWSDIDFNKGIMYITKTVTKEVVDKEVKYIVDTPKTITSIREIPLPIHIMNNLVRLKNSSKSMYVVNNKGDICMPYRYSLMYKKMLETIKVRKLCFHTLRHTFATRAIENGIDMRTLSEILGHTDPSFTLRVYGHSLLKHKKKAMNKIKKLV